MWIYLSDAFVSIVEHRNDPDTLICRARLQGDLQRVFRGHLRNRRVRHTPNADYAFRLELPRKVVASVIAANVSRIDYDNFKGSVTEADRHSLYMRVWSSMKAEQDRREFEGARLPFPLGSRPRAIVIDDVEGAR